MTYQEIKDRLSKCELTLEKLKNGTNLSKETQVKTEKLELLRESYLRLLERKEETMFISTKGGQDKVVKLDKTTATDLKKDPDITSIETSRGQKIKEQEGLKFNIDETKAIAKKVGKAVAMGLRELGDQVKSMKATNIEEGSFEIQINYKGEGPGDEFSFYIVEDTLHLTDFSFDKELVDVGVKPSGEAILNVDVLANELAKHWKSMNEDLDEGHYDNYKPKHFDICPGAETLRNRVLDGEFGEQEPVVVGKWTELHDELFAIEKLAIKKNFAQDAHVRMANDRKDQIINLSREMNIPEEAIGYLKGHIDKIIDIGKKSGGIKEVNEAPDDMYYFKVPRTDKAKLNAAQNTIETFYDPVRFADIVDDDGAGNVIMYIHKKDFDPGMIDDLQGDGIDLSSSNFPGVNEGEKEEDGADTDYAKRRREEDDYYEDPDYYKENKAEDTGGDLDVGHQDDEPDMLKAYVYDIAVYASKLYKQLDKYDKYDGEVDFPNWWQSKVILAKDYISKAQHYLEFEEKQPAIDQLALEENVNKIAGGIPFKREGNKIIITEPLDDATKQRIMKRAKEHGHHAAPNMAGGVTIMAKEGKYKSDAQRKAIYATKAEDEVQEALSPEKKEAIYDLQNILDRASELGDEAREIIRNEFPTFLSQGDSYGVFNFGTSGNSYDTTLESMIEDILRTGEEEDLEEGIGKTRKALDLVVNKMKELAKLYKAGDKSVVDQLKDLTAKKKKLEAMLDSDVADIGRDQELTEGRGDLESITSIIDDRAAESGFDVKDEAIEVIEAIADYYKLGNIDFEFQNEAELSKSERSKLKDIVKQLKKSVKGHDAQQKYIDSLVKKESAPGYKHDCASKVVHEKYGAGTCIPEKHTLIKEGDKFVVTHYDVLFENGKTVEYIPVEELEIKTQTEHWHKGYKKKKK